MIIKLYENIIDIHEYCEANTVSFLGECLCWIMHPWYVDKRNSKTLSYNVIQQDNQLFLEVLDFTETVLTI